MMQPGCPSFCSSDRILFREFDGEVSKLGLSPFLLGVFTHL